MSLDSAKAFLERMENDQEFAQKITAIKTAADRMTMVKEAGYDFSSQEIESLKQALTDEELEEVVGGNPLFAPGRCGSNTPLCNHDGVPVPK